MDLQPVLLGEAGDQAGDPRAGRDLTFFRPVFGAARRSGILACVTSRIHGTDPAARGKGAGPLAIRHETEEFLGSGALQEEAPDRPEELRQLPGLAGRQVDPEDPRVVVAEIAVPSPPRSSP